MFRLVPALCACALLGLTACGTNVEDPGGAVAERAQSRARQPVTPRDLGAAEQGSPFHRLLQWWRLVQYRNPKDSLELFSPEIRRRLEGEDYASLVYRDVGPWLQQIKPRLERTEFAGDEATLFLKLTINELVNPSLVRPRQEPLALPMRRVGSEWFIDDETFFLANGRRLRDARIAREAAQASPRTTPRAPEPR